MYIDGNSKPEQNIEKDFFLYKLTFNKFNNVNH